MDYLLHIETATPVCSAALSHGEKILAVKETRDENSHSSMLTVFIQQLFDETGINISEIKAISVSEGPGSYTGLRIGVSVAKGLCYALNIPLIAVSTLKSMAIGFLKKNKPTGDNFLMCPAIDARRMEIYYALYNQDLKLIEPPSAKVLTPEFLHEYGEKQLFLFGTGAGKSKQVRFSNDIKVIEENYNSAVFLASIANEKFLEKSFEDVAYFEPFYLKEFYSRRSFE